MGTLPTTAASEPVPMTAPAGEPVPMTAPAGEPGRDHRRRGRRRKTWVSGGVVAAVLVTGGVAWWSTRPDPVAAPQTRAVAATVGTMRMTTSTTGTLAAAQEADLSFQVSGEVTTVRVAVGQQVTAGQILATVSSASLAAQVAQAEATLAQAQARLSSDRSASAGSAQLAADTAAVTAAKSALANVRATLSQATLTSPVAGTVAALDLSVGQQVSGSGSSSGSGATSGGQAGNAASNQSAASGSGTSAAASAQIVVLSKAFVVNATVDATQIGFVKKGEQAVIVPQGSTTPVYGTVTSVGLLGTTTSGVASYPLVVSVTGTPTGLFSGATAAVSIVYRQLSDVVQVPAAAVHYAGGTGYVEMARNGGTVRRQVGVGASTGGMTEITSGLDEGEQVLVTVSTTGTGAGTGAGTGQSRQYGGGAGGQGGPPGGFGGSGFGGRGGAGG